MHYLKMYIKPRSSERQHSSSPSSSIFIFISGSLRVTRMRVCSVVFYCSWGTWFCSLQIEKAVTDQGNDAVNLLGLFIGEQVGDLFRH